MKQFRDVAGLLTCFLFRASFPSFSDSGLRVPDELRETHSSGSVQDFHLIPFSSPGRIARRGHHSRHYSVANVARRIHSSKCSRTNLRRLFPVFPPLIPHLQAHDSMPDASLLLTLRVCQKAHLPPAARRKMRGGAGTSPGGLLAASWRGLGGLPKGGISGLSPVHRLSIACRKWR